MPVILIILTPYKLFSNFLTFQSLPEKSKFQGPFFGFYKRDWKT